MFVLDDIYFFVVDLLFVISDTLVKSALQTILKTAGKLVLLVTAKNYQGAVEGSIPVLIESVRSSASYWSSL